MGGGGCQLFTSDGIVTQSNGAVEPDWMQPASPWTTYYLSAFADLDDDSIRERENGNILFNQTHDTCFGKCGEGDCDDYLNLNRDEEKHSHLGNSSQPSIGSHIDFPGRLDIDYPSISNNNVDSHIEWYNTADNRKKLNYNNHNNGIQKISLPRCKWEFVDPNSNDGSAVFDKQCTTTGGGTIPVKRLSYRKVLSPYLGNAADNDRILDENDSYETVYIDNVSANVDGYYLLDIGSESIIKSITISNMLL